MGALPKKKVTKSRRGMRRSHHRLQPMALGPCPQCRQPRVAHRACPHCGMYQGRQVLEIKVEKAQSR